MKKSAAMIASVAYHLAMRDELLPRFTKADMPEPTARPAAPTPPASPATASATTPTRQ